MTAPGTGAPSALRVTVPLSEAGVLGASAGWACAARRAAMTSPPEPPPEPVPVPVPVPACEPQRCHASTPATTRTTTTPIPTTLRRIAADYPQGRKRARVSAVGIWHAGSIVPHTR